MTRQTCRRRHVCTQAGRQTHRQIHRGDSDGVSKLVRVRKIDIQIDRETDREADIYAGRHAGKQSCGHAEIDRQKLQEDIQKLETAEIEIHRASE